MEKSYQTLMLMFDELLSLLIESEEYKNYQALRQKLKKNQEILSLIDKVRKLQKELVRKEHSQMDVISTLEEYHTVVAKLSEIPLYHAYQSSQQEINSYLQTIKTSIEMIIESVILP